MLPFFPLPIGFFRDFPWRRKPPKAPFFDVLFISEVNALIYNLIDSGGHDQKAALGLLERALAIPVSPKAWKQEAGCRTHFLSAPGSANQSAAKYFNEQDVWLEVLGYRGKHLLKDFWVWRDGRFLFFQPVIGRRNSDNLLYPWRAFALCPARFTPGRYCFGKLEPVAVADSQLPFRPWKRGLCLSIEYIVGCHAPKLELYRTI